MNYVGIDLITFKYDELIITNPKKFNMGKETPKTMKIGGRVVDLKKDGTPNLRQCKKDEKELIKRTIQKSIKEKKELKLKELEEALKKLL